ncbi:MAG: TGS domain-containing protein, partial [Bacteroidota bacterium]
QAYIDDFVESVRELLRRSGLRFKVKSRFKTVSSIYNKMQRQGVGFSEVYDLFAIRIILKPRARHEIAECWRAYSVISEKFTPNPKRLRDWITVPKENGYESLHVTVMGSGGRWVEVQIRTEDMDANAELGIAAHAKYKDGEMFEDNRWNEWIDKVRHILNDPELSDLEAVRSFRANLEPNNVFVFTPKGELYRMPTGASVLDLAYAIHTDIGDSAMGAKVDGTVVSLDYLLKPGDQVEVINSKKPRPSVEWLRMVKTPRAKEFIKRALAKQRRESIQKGREMFLWRAKKYNITEDHEVMKELLAFVMQPTKEDFYFALYQRQISADRIEKFIELKRNGNAVDTKYISQWEKKRQARLNTFEELGLSEDNLVLTSNEHLEEYALATCCKPMPGDSILGFLTGNKVTIHRTSCPKAIELMSNFGSRIIKAKWKEGGSHIDFMAGLKVVGLDKVGMLSELIQVLTYKMKLNIRKVTIESMDGMFEGVFIIYVKDIEELQAAVDRIVKLPSVFSVSRVDSDYVPFQDGPPQSSTGKASSLAT